MSTVFRYRVFRVLNCTWEGTETVLYTVEAETRTDLPEGQDKRVAPTILELVEELFANPFAREVKEAADPKKAVGDTFEYCFPVTNYVTQEQGFLPSWMMPLDEDEQKTFFEAYGSKVKAMASKEYRGDDIATQIAEKVIGMSAKEVAALIKERGLEHLTDPARIAEILNLPPLN